MSSPSRKKDKVAESLSNLTLDIPKSSNKASKPKKKVAVADSWEDEDGSSDAENELRPSVVSPTVPSAPPPTPFAANYGSIPGWDDAGAPGNDSPSEAGAGSTRRPEKTDAVARRMIAAGLGMKAPKQTEEQRAYQKSIKEQERKKREQDREEEHQKKMEADKAKAAIWDE